MGSSFFSWRAGYLARCHLLVLESRSGGLRGPTQLPNLPQKSAECCASPASHLAPRKSSDRWCGYDCAYRDLHRRFHVVSIREWERCCNWVPRNTQRLRQTFPLYGPHSSPLVATLALLRNLKALRRMGIRPLLRDRRDRGFPESRVRSKDLDSLMTAHPD